MLFYFSTRKIRIFFSDCMRVEEVKDKQGFNKFLSVQHIIYRNDDNWICPLDTDLLDVFDRNENAYYNDGDAAWWILRDKKNKLIGRVAAFYHEKYFSQTGQRTGGMGFFECINNQHAANLLFDTCKKWLSGKGITGMDGPINFGEKDRFWGLMVKGFVNPSYLENYNPPYYQKLFENYGFQKIVEQSTSEVLIENFNYERFNKIASRVISNPAYRFEHYRDDNITKFANDFIKIFNEAWASRPDFTPMTFERVMATLKSLRPILREDLIWFVYANNEPAGFYINTIEVNQIFKYLRGKMNLWAKLKFLWYRKFGNIDRCRGIVFGVVPQYQNLGLEAGMIIKLYNALKNHPNLKASELSWIGDFNPKMHSLFEALGATYSKVHYTYHYSFK